MTTETREPATAPDLVKPVSKNAGRLSNTEQAPFGLKLQPQQSGTGV